jgi:hypothetical protein|tara:strand:+ start:5873 stop:6466 length:594 start_codon:yes stop_codon:yes gene_type:complete
MAVTSTPANTPIDVSSRALILIGAQPITSFEDNSTEALVCANMYEDIARSALLSTRWRFSTNQAVLNRLTEAPTGRYDSAYQIPTGSLMVHAVTVNESPIEYNIYGSKVFCDASEADQLVADYTYRSEESDWPSYFTIAVEHSLAAVLATSIARDRGLSELMAAQYNNLMVKARNLDSQQQTTRKLYTSRFIAQRRS